MVLTVFICEIGLDVYILSAKGIIKEFQSNRNNKSSSQSFFLSSTSFRTTTLATAIDS